MQNNYSDHILNKNMQNNSGIYFDYQATTPIDDRVLNIMLPYMTQDFGNPHSSEHAYGWKANDAVEKAKEQISNFIDSLDTEIIFTSGATESNNLAIIGTGYTALNSSKKRTILVSSIEHKCVLGSARFLERFGFNVIKIPVNSDGLIDFNAFEQLLNEDVLLVSIMATNNEIGVNQDLARIGLLCKKNDIIFHVDAAQGAYSNINVVDNNIDLMSLSAHKVYGPKGIGALYINQDLKIKPSPLIQGGGQQDGYRSGTIPAYLAAGMGYAFELLSNEKESEIKKILGLKELMLNGLKNINPNIKVNGNLTNRHPGNLNILLPNADARQLILSLQPHLAFSTGSACTSGIQEPSHVLKAIGLSTTEAERSFRITIGRFSTNNDIEYFLENISKHSL